MALCYPELAISYIRIGSVTPCLRWGG